MNMPTERDGKKYYCLGEAAQVSGMGINTLLMWVNAGELDSFKDDALDIFIEEQSLRARVARRFGGGERDERTGL